MFVINTASRILAYTALQNDERLRDSKLVAGCTKAKKTTNKVAACRPPGLTERALRNPSAKKPARDGGSGPQTVWLSPPQPAKVNPRKWWNLVAAAGMSWRASEESWGKPFEAPNVMLISSTEDLARAGAGQLHYISGARRKNQLLR